MLLGHVVVELRRAIADRDFLIDHGGKHFVIDFDHADGIVGLSQGFGHHQCHAFADETNAIGRDHRTVTVPCCRE